MKPIKTIGHSNHPIERFVSLLKAGAVERLVDVRSMPWSRRFPQFGRERLAQSLAEAGIDYVWEGEALGGKPKDGGGYDELAARSEFKDAVGRLLSDSAGTTLALMCAEKEPLECHRTILVGRALAQRDTELGHIHADGRIEPHAALEERLLHLAKEKVDLLNGRDAALAQAYDKQGRRMAYGAADR